MNTDQHNRRAFLLSFVKGAIATAAVGALGARFVEVAEAIPLVPERGLVEEPSDLIPAQAAGRSAAGRSGRP
jgi:hypothetical protein